MPAQLSSASAVEALELSQLARHAFTLAQKFNNYYHKYHIINEDDPRLKEMRALLVRLFRSRMERTLSILGIWNTSASSWCSSAC